MIDLRGKRALVTGAGTRVGAAIAEALGAQGMQVAVHHHGSATGAELTCTEVALRGGQAFALHADLRDEAATRQLVRDACLRMGGLDLLVPSAASFDPTEFSTATRQEWERTLALNLLAPFVLAQESAAALRVARGSIVFITCTSRVLPFAGYVAYEASKAALHQVMRVLALELAPDVRVNSVAPGTVLPPVGMPATELGRLLEQIPLARIGGADAVAQAVVALARSAFVTGSEVIVDGGRSLG
jgi:pteridine reductase